MFPVSGWSAIPGSNRRYRSRLNREIPHRPHTPMMGGSRNRFLPTMRPCQSRRAGRAQFPPLVTLVAGIDAPFYYVEMAHPDDVARRVTGVPDEAGEFQTANSVRYGLLGHDIEKGIVLRARVRGLWISSATPEEDAQALFREFLREPPPLGP